MNVVSIARVDDDQIGDYRNIREGDFVKRRGLFIAEGPEVVRTLLSRSRCSVVSVFLLDKRLDAMRDALSTRPDVPVFVASPAVMNEIVGFNVHRGCLAVGARPTAIDPLEKNFRRLLLLESLVNSDNVGAAFRNAAAFGADAVILDERCADPLYRKAIRTSMGHALTVPFARSADWLGTLEHLVADGCRLVALSPRASMSIRDLEVESDRVALLVGTEGAGLRAESVALATDRVSVEMAEGVDSLNVATAAAIALYELFR